MLVTVVRVRQGSEDSDTDERGGEPVCRYPASRAGIAASAWAVVSLRLTGNPGLLAQGLSRPLDLPAHDLCAAEDAWGLALDQVRIDDI